LRQGDDKLFKPRAVAGAPTIEEGDRPEYLVLDGQQRLTSLYQAHRGVGDARYLVHFEDLVDAVDDLDTDTLDFDQIVTFEAVKKDKPVVSDDLRWQYDNWTFPIHRFLTDGFDTWLNNAVAHHGGDADVQLRRRLRLADVRQVLLNPLGSYSFP